MAKYFQDFIRRQLGVLVGGFPADIAPVGLWDNTYFISLFTQAEIKGSFWPGLMGNGAVQFYTIAPNAYRAIHDGAGPGVLILTGFGYAVCRSLGDWSRWRGLVLAMAAVPNLDRR